ncbi:hypothetical protein O4G76_17790 [Limimaricola sp. G21655-S1]|uniref:DUF6958 family protein n=1 Tax=Limimaricola sp. G21655-S1 TaxID=3014768 RepID=UPI0022AF8C34|nr:hypothetical protein [Limimaricola sp. G21655-S1]MCZ4262692.1 hypothetical protein [Limimaricola sp. G21655-S1]
MSKTDEMIEISSATSPGRTERVNRAKYTAMREALLTVLPDTPPGVTVAEAKAAALEYLSQEHFPGGEKAGWWLKAVQLDLEAKGIIARGATRPVRLYRSTE